MSNRSRNLYRLWGLFLALNLAVGYCIYASAAADADQSEGFAAMRKFAQVLKLIRKDYVDGGKVDYEHLIDGALDGMLGSLDRFSSYIDQRELEQMREETEGEFGGIGVVISIKDNVLTVIAPMEGTPGMRAGIMANDRIMKVGDKETINLSLDECVDLIKGKPGTNVKLTIFRPGSSETKTFDIERGIIDLLTVKDRQIIDPDIGYVRVTQFNEKTAEALTTDLKELEKSVMRGLIIDLRNNPGGLLTSAIQVSSIFIPYRKLVVFTEGRTESRRQEFYALKTHKFPEMPIVVLINEGSASAAEIVAGCLQDYGRALIVGEKSFGKGSVQSIIELDDQSAVRLTTAKYYTPSKRVIHEHGIEPDFLVDITDEQSHQLALQRSRLPGTVDQPDPAKDIEDPQLNRAVELIKGLVAMTRGRKVDYAKVIREAEKKNPPARPEGEIESK